MVSQPFLYIYVGKYTIVMVEVTTQEYVYNISYISTFYNNRQQQSQSNSCDDLVSGIEVVVLSQRNQINS